MNKLLEVKDLNVLFNSRRQKVHAVRGISFDIYEGETLGIVGESGSGKTAALKSLVKLHPEYSTQVNGQALFQEKELITCYEKEMQHIRGKEIGMIFQDPMTSLNPTLRIGSQIMEGYLRHHPLISLKEAHAYTLKLLKWVCIPEPEKRLLEYPHTLSGGMRQRIMIALALAPKPKLLLADEPTTALDVTIQAQILDLLKKIQRQTKCSILLITHDLSVIASICDRVLVMYAGKIVESGSVHEVFANPKHPYTQRLLQSIPRLDQPKDHILFPIEGSPPNLAEPLPGCAFSARCPHAMKICSSQEPPFFDNQAKCWLYAKGEKC